jgi:hypothetical protein
MLKRLGRYVRRHHVGLIALFVAMGGTAYAGGAIDGPAPSTDSVGSLDIIDRQVLSSDIGPNQAKGADVDEASLKGVTGACPSLMTKFAQSFCLDDSARGPATWEGAVDLCAQNGLRLPTIAEAAYADHYGHFGADEIVWTDSVFDGGDNDNLLDLAITYDHIGIATSPMSDQEDVYCASAVSDAYG